MESYYDRNKEKCKKKALEYYYNNKSYCNNRQKVYYRTIYYPIRRIKMLKKAYGRIVLPEETAREYRKEIIVTF
jgi:hypothetical protein